MTIRQSEVGGIHYKDETLSQLAERANVAQFVSFNTKLEVRHSRVHGYSPDAALGAPPEAAVASVLRASTEKSVNVRSYTPDRPKSREFIYGLRSVEEVMAGLSRLANEGLYTIVNE